jgi:adenylate cyclase
LTNQRRLAAILASDVAGYSRLTGADEEGTVAQLRAVRAELFEPTVAANHGRIVKSAGDGMLIEFASVVDAVRAGIAVQREMAARAAGIAAERQILLRIGIHLGDVLVESDGDLMGDGVNIAARLEGICEPGGICLSEDAWRQVRDKVDAPFVDIGEKALKNIARPVRVYALQNSVVVPAKAGPDVKSPPRLSIVVLPFANMSGDAEQEYFVDGLTEDLTTELSRIPGAFVIARNTAFTYKGKASDVKAIGRELGVRYALEGSVRKAGNRVRLNTQLIDAETGAHVWADRFDRELTDLFELQDTVTLELASVLNVQLIEAETKRAKPVLNLDAFDLVLRARAERNRGLTREHNTETLRLFSEALRLDPKHVPALSGKALSLGTKVTSLWTEDRVADIAEAEALALRALALDAQNPECHFVLGFVRRLQFRFDEAAAEYEAALRENTNFAGAETELGWVKSFSGRAAKALPHFERAMRLSPRDPSTFLNHFGVGYIHFELGAYDKAIEPLRHATSLNPNFSWSQLILTASLVLVGRVDEARAALAAYFRTNPASKTIADVRANLVTDRMIQSPLFDALRQAGMPDA